MIQKAKNVTCNKCGSDDLETKTVFYNKQYRRVWDCDSLRQQTRLKSEDEYLSCYCNKCGNRFEERMRTRTFDLAPYEVEITW